MKWKNRFILIWVVFLGVLPNLVFGQDTIEQAVVPAIPSLDKGDTAWLIISSAMVFFMIPGLALFYGGIVRSKNVLSTMMHSFIAILVISIQWAIFGYSFAFSGSSPYHGDFQMLLLGQINENTLEGTIPKYVHFLFQGMFAIITPALISGAIAERVKLSGYIVFIFLWATFVYDPVAHWVWASEGFLFKKGALDFAGGTVVHLISGVAGLATALVIGRRKGELKSIANPNNMTYTLIGAGLLWFGSAVCLEKTNRHRPDLRTKMRPRFGLSRDPSVSSSKSCQKFQNWG
ncbi:MAG: ammonium transporter [Leptospiraceae bacterium]|nr:ammonium transporter [Leptospiraceae bacterium]